MTPRRMVWFGYAAIILTIVWGIGIVPAWLVVRAAKASPLPDGVTAPVRRDYRGGLLLARIGLATNGIAVAFIIWMLISTYVV